MISPPSSPVFNPSSRSISGKHQAENENPPLSPKRSFAQLEEDQTPLPGLKRRDTHSRRAPLYPLSVSDWKNRPTRNSQLTDSASHRTLVSLSLVPDLRALHPEQPASAGSCGMQRNAVSDALVCSWPPPIPTPGTARSSHSGLAGQVTSQCGPPHSPDEKVSSRATFPQPISTAWSAANTPHIKPTTTTMTNPTRITGWKSENVHQPIRTRTHSMPSVRRPPGELWRSESRPSKADHDPVNATDLLAYPTPPGLSPPRPELRRSGSHSDLLPHGSVSLSLAVGSQPLTASDPTKAVPPIGAERSQVVSITSLKAHIRNPPTTRTHAPSQPSSLLLPRLQAKWKNQIHSLNTTSSENVQTPTSDASMSKEALERLLRHAVRNKHAPKIISPLSPLRTETSALDLSADSAYQQRTPSQFNNPSPRYSKCPAKRARTMCDGYQSFDWNATCTHCQECKRDNIGKRLLAFRYRQQQTRHLQRNRLITYPSRSMTAPVGDDDRMVLADRIREVFAYEMDEEEKSLWAEVAAVTGAEPMSFLRVGAPCGIAAHRRVVNDGSDDGSHDDHLDVPDDGLLANESATLFREVSVY